MRFYLNSPRCVRARIRNSRLKKTCLKRVNSSDANAVARNERFGNVFRTSRGEVAWLFQSARFLKISGDCERDEGG